MSAPHLPWITWAWQHWHRPWAVMHPSWRGEALPAAPELALRLHYPAWCHGFGLDPELREFSDSTWWRLFGLATVPFERVAQRVGLTLLFAANPRQRLMRCEPAADVSLVRWALARAHFVPDPGLVAQSSSDAAHAARSHAAMSLRGCMFDEAPTLWGRMRMRLARDHVEAGGEQPPSRIEAGARVPQARLWAAAVKLEQPQATQAGDPAAASAP